MSFLKKLDALLNKLGEHILVLTGSVVCLTIFVNAVMRYVIHVEIFGNEELIMFFAFWLYFIGSAVAAREGSHINANMMTLITHDPKVLSIAAIVKNVFSLGICTLVTYWCGAYVYWSVAMNARSNIYRLPNVIAQFPIFLSFLLWDCYLIRDLVNSVKALKKEGK